METPDTDNAEEWYKEEHGIEGVVLSSFARKQEVRLRNFKREKFMVELVHIEDVKPTQKAMATCGEFEWKPIESAPKDGVSILAYSKYGGAWEPLGGYCVVVKWHEKAFPKNGGWISADANEPDEGSTYCGLTHWMHVRPPPAEA